MAIEDWPLEVRRAFVARKLAGDFTEECQRAVRTAVEGLLFSRPLRRWLRNVLPIQVRPIRGALRIGLLNDIPGRGLTTVSLAVWTHENGTISIVLQQPQILGSRPVRQYEMTVEGATVGERWHTAQMLCDHTFPFIVVRYWIDPRIPF